MFKRANKVTALLVAAASIMSVVPAMASERLGTKDGNIYSAYAFKDGKYIYDGYRDDNDTAVYFNDGKDKQVEDLNDVDFTGTGNTVKYGDKYLSVNDGSDEYLVDLSTGKVTDEDLASDLIATAETKLNTKFKKLDRYQKVAGSVTAINQISGNQFGDVWYSYTATTSGGAAYGFTNGTADYIDASHRANISVYDGTKMVKFDNYGDTSGTIKLTLNSVRAIAQDADYIYALADVQFDKTVYDFSDDTSATANYVIPAGTSVQYLQKISKAQDTSDDIDGAKIPKTVASYEVTTKSGNDDVKEAANRLAIASPLGVRAIDGTIYVTTLTGGKVKTSKIVLKNDKLTPEVGTSGTKIDIKVAKKDADKEEDATDASIDVDGNVWRINKGEISVSVKAGDFTTKFTCDRSIDKLDVYNEGSLVAWDASGDVYTTVTEGKAETATEATPVAPAKIGWDKLADGSWNFLDTTGTKVVNNWVNYQGAWYFLKADGVMATGWLNQNGTWYFLKPSGAMVTGWYNDNGTWYYLNASGAMLANTTVDGYVLGASGAWVK